jgi:hypothetical protein
MWRFACLGLASSAAFGMAPPECSNWPALSSNMLASYRIVLSATTSQLSSVSEAWTIASDFARIAQACARAGRFGEGEGDYEWFAGRMDLSVSCALAAPNSTGTASFGSRDIRTGTGFIGSCMNKPSLPSLPEVNRVLQRQGELVKPGLERLPTIAHVLTLPGSSAADLLSQSTFAVPIRGLLVLAEPNSIDPLCGDFSGQGGLQWHLLVAPTLIEEVDCQVIEGVNEVVLSEDTPSAVQLDVNGRTMSPGMLPLKQASARAPVESLQRSIDKGMDVVTTSSNTPVVEAMILPRVQCLIAGKRMLFVDFCLADAYVRHEVAKGVATAALVSGVPLRTSTASALINQSPEGAASQCINEYLTFLEESLRDCGLSNETIAAVKEELIHPLEGTGGRCLRRLYVAPGVSTGFHTLIAARFKNAGQRDAELAATYDAWSTNIRKATAFLERSSFGAIKWNVITLPDVYIISPPETICNTNTLSTTGLRQVAAAHPELGLSTDPGAPLPARTHFSSTFPGEPCKLWWAGLANVGNGLSWIASEYTGLANGDDSMLLWVHELGHNLGSFRRASR